jgi:hypothetical protein
MKVIMNAKTAGALSGAGLGAGGAYALAPDATVLTIYVAGLGALPPAVLEATERLTTAGWSAAIMLAMAAFGHVMLPRPAEPAPIAPGAPPA